MSAIQLPAGQADLLLVMAGRSAVRLNGRFVLADRRRIGLTSDLHALRAAGLVRCGDRPFGTDSVASVGNQYYLTDRGRAVAAQLNPSAVGGERSDNPNGSPDLGGVA